MSYKYEINFRDNKSSLDLFVGAEFETVYSYDNGTITLSERLDPALVTPTNYRDNLNQIRGWIYKIDTELGAQKYSLGLFEKNVERKNNQTEMKFKSGTLTVTTAKYKFSELIFDFDPRPEVVFNFTLFKLWYQTLEEFYESTL